MEAFEGGYGFPADIWSLGIVIYQCLCGSLPFARKDWRSSSDLLQERIRDGKTSYPASSWSTAARLVLYIMDLMLVVDPSQRIPLTEDLDRQALTATPTSTRLSCLLSKDQCPFGTLCNYASLGPSSRHLRLEIYKRAQSSTASSFARSTSHQLNLSQLMVVYNRRLFPLSDEEKLIQEAASTLAEMAADRRRTIATRRMSKTLSPLVVQALESRKYALEESFR